MGVFSRCSVLNSSHRKQFTLATELHSLCFIRKNIYSLHIGVGVLKHMICTDLRVSRMTICLEKMVLQKKYLKTNLDEIMRFLLVKIITWEKLFFHSLNVYGVLCLLARK